LLLHACERMGWRRILELVRRGLVLYTFGNVSRMDRVKGFVAIEPSGMPCEELTVAQIVISDLAGKIVDCTLRPSFAAMGLNR
jgi:L-ribulose-5-phosphate 4-epimerase